MDGKTLRANLTFEDDELGTFEKTMLELGKPYGLKSFTAIIRLAANRGINVLMEEQQTKNKN